MFRPLPLQSIIGQLPLVLQRLAKKEVMCHSAAVSNLPYYALPIQQRILEGNSSRAPCLGRNNAGSSCGQMSGTEIQILRSREKASSAATLEDVGSTPVDTALADPLRGPATIVDNQATSPAPVLKVAVEHPLRVYKMEAIPRPLPPDRLASNVDSLATSPTTAPKVQIRVSRAEELVAATIPVSDAVNLDTLLITAHNLEPAPAEALGEARRG